MKISIAAGDVIFVMLAKIRYECGSCHKKFEPMTQKELEDKISKMLEQKNTPEVSLDDDVFWQERHTSTI